MSRCRVGREIRDGSTCSTKTIIIAGRYHRICGDWCLGVSPAWVLAVQLDIGDSRNILSKVNTISSFDACIAVNTSDTFLASIVHS